MVTDYPKLVELPELKELTLSVRGDDFKYIPDLPRLEEFRFNEIPIRREPAVAYMVDHIQYPDYDFSDFPNLEGLKVLDLVHPGISLQSFERIISKTPNITQLDLMSKVLKNDDLLCITKLRQLRKCSLDGTKVKGSTMKKLATELPDCEFVV